MKTMRKAACLALAGAISSIALSASAAVYTYTLGDVPSGGASNDFDYGLRLDDYPGGQRFYSFQDGKATLVYNSVSGEVVMSGFMIQSTGVGATTGSDVALSYTISGVNDLGDGFFDTTSCGTGEIDGFELGCKGREPDGKTFLFSDSPSHSKGGPGAIVGEGWVDWSMDLTGANDFLFTATLKSVTPVPLPAAGFMLLAGLGGLGAMRKLRK